MHERAYCVYIIASRSLTLYIGVTGNLQHRVRQHKEHSFDGFTTQYKIDRLVYFERFQYINNAINREKQLKRWCREKKIALIKSLNPTWIDLSEEWGKPIEMQVPPLRNPVRSGGQDCSGRDDKPCC
jgi:putative endonuclease